MIVLRSTAEITSAQPATARKNRASSRFAVRPKATIAAPQTMTATITVRPCRRMRTTQPVASAPASAPTPGAAYRNPTVVAPPPKTFTAVAGKRARGMPNTMALMSIR